MQSRYKVLNDLATLPDNDLIARVKVIIICLTGNAAFPTLPVALAAIQSLLDALQTAVNNMAMYSTPESTAKRDETREALLDAMRKTAAYVQSVALNSLSTLLSSGFESASSPSPQAPLDPPVILQVANLASTQVLLRLQPVDNAAAYEVRYTPDAGKTWLNGILSTQARRIVVPNLSPGTTYALQARAVGGSTGYSDWSTQVTIMST